MLRLSVLLVFGVTACSGKGPRRTPPEDMVEVPAATITLGCRDPSGPSCDRAGVRPKTVELAGFSIDRTEVTAGDYRRCVEAKVCTPLLEPRQRDMMPARLDWDQADAYCRWRGARLPREAQWELAARGTDDRLYPWGNTPPTCDAVRYRNSCGHGPADFADVGTYPRDKSPYGALDMAGNAPEWVEEPRTYDYEPDVELLDERALATRIVRGDTSSLGPPCCPIYTRSSQTKVLRMGGSVHPSFIGVRCVRESARGKQ